jgi:hypothetical protein
MPTELFGVVILEITSYFYLGQPEPQSSYFKLPIVAGMTSECHQLFSVVMGGLTNFFACTELELVILVRVPQPST